MIPMASDVAALIGEYAEGVENKGLLYEKYSLPKEWGHDQKMDDAARWSVLRIVSGGSDLLRRDAADSRYRAGGRNVEEFNQRKHMAKAELATKLSVTANAKSLSAAAIENTRALLKDLESSFPGRVATFTATLAGRMMVNLAGGVVENAGICLDRCFGLSMIPGSAVKGISRTQALWEVKDAAEPEKKRLLLLAMTLFGYGGQDISAKGDFAWAGGDIQLVRQLAKQIGAEEFKGCACFLPATPTSEPKLVVDMVNPHYPDYYTGKRQKALDNEGPKPNYFPAVEAGASFGFAVLVNRVPGIDGICLEDLLAAARGWIERGVTEKGVGAKTGAGYGWFRTGTASSTAGVTMHTPSAPSESTAPASPADALITKYRTGGLSNTSMFAKVLPELAALIGANDLKKAFEELVPEEQRKRMKKGNPYWQSFTSGKHSDAGKSIIKRLGLELK